MVSVVERVHAHEKISCGEEEERPVEPHRRPAAPLQKDGAARAKGVNYCSRVGGDMFYVFYPEVTVSHGFSRM